MASLYFKGGATATAQVDTLTVGGTVEADDVFTITITDEAGTAQALAVVAGSTTISVVCTTIAAAFNASTNPAFTPITAAAGATTVTLTADTAGQPFTCTVATTENGGGAADSQTFVRAATTASNGPADWNIAANWSTGVKPVNSDTVFIDGRAANAITYGLNQGAVTLAALYITRGMRFNVGTHEFALIIGATLEIIGKPPEDGSNASMGAIINISNSSIQTVAHFYGSRNGGTNSKPPINWKGTHASNVVNIYDGIVGIGSYVPAEAATVATLNILGENSRVTIGVGVTVTTLYQENGETVLGCAATTINQDAGKITTEGSGAYTTVNAGGTFVSNSTGTIGTINVEGNGYADFTQSTTARTVSNANCVGKNARLNADNGVPLSITFSAGVDCENGCPSSNVNFGDGLTVTASAL